MTYASDFIKALSPALEEMSDHKRAIGAQAYMKDIAPFVGVATPERRATVKRIAKAMKTPTSEELGATARRTFSLTTLRI
jgi:3-methyladenine DNA glycosylase AlkD